MLFKITADWGTGDYTVVLVDAQDGEIARELALAADDDLLKAEQLRVESIRTPVQIELDHENQSDAFTEVLDLGQEKD